MLSIYRIVTFLLYPLFILFIYFRSILNKEDSIRYKEKIFSSAFNANRNEKKKLIWLHAASIGETLSILPLVEKLNTSNKNVDFLITTVTLSSANLLKKKISEFDNVEHRFFPLDTERLSKKFLSEWKPDLICFVDSEIWPNFLFTIKKNNIPLRFVHGFCKQVIDLSIMGRNSSFDYTIIRKGKTSGGVTLQPIRKLMIFL